MRLSRIAMLLAGAFGVDFAPAGERPIPYRRPEMYQELLKSEE
jgi:hypothetical protein